MVTRQVTQSWPLANQLSPSLKTSGEKMSHPHWSSHPHHGLGRTYSSASEAFKDADYATPIWRCESDNQRAWREIKGIFGWLCILGIGVFLLYLFAFPIFTNFFGSTS
jgi:hypothetical protein